MPTASKTLSKIFLVGPMGSGKTTIGRILARKLQLDFYDSDREIEERSGADIPWIFALEGEEGFRKRECQVIEELTALDRVVLATGGGAILSPHNRALLKSRGMVIYLKTTVQQQLSRTKKGKHRPLLQTEDPQKKLIELITYRAPLYEEVADWTFATDGDSVQALADRIIKFLQTK